MWKPNSARVRVGWPGSHWRPSPFAAVALALVFWAAACTSGSTPTEVPTQTLIPATATNTPVIPTLTPTPQSLPGPADLLTDLPPGLDTLETEEERQIARLAMNHLARSEAVSVDQIEVAHIESTEWRSRLLLDCPNPPETVTDPWFSGYRVVLTAQGAVYDYHTDTGSRARLCDQTPVRDASGDLLQFIDPIAAGMVGLAQRRLAQQLDLPERRIQMVDIHLVTWPDESLGCPAEGQTYADRDIDGYRLVMSAGDTEYIFHADFERLIACAVDDEVLPTEEPEETEEPVDE